MDKHGIFISVNSTTSKMCITTVYTERKGNMPVKNLKRITFSLEPKMVEKLEEVQKKVGIFSRPEMYRQVVKAGLEKLSES